MQDYPRHRIAARAIVDFASDGEGDMRGAIAQLEEGAGSAALARRHYLTFFQNQAGSILIAEAIIA